MYKLKDNSKIKLKWTLEEDIELAKLYIRIGPKWSKISKQFTGRNDNQLKNRFH